MTHAPRRLSAIFTPLVLGLLVGAGTAAEAQPLLPDPSATDPAIGVSSDNVRTERTDAGLVVTVTPGKDQYPGIMLTPTTPWNLGEFTTATARIVNTGTNAMTFCIRVDNAGDWKTNPWNGDQAKIAAGKSGEVKVQFGRSWGKPGFALNASAITALRIYTGSAKEALSYRIESIVAEGSAAERAALALQKRPRDGRLFGGDAPAITEDRVRSKKATATLQTTASGQAVECTFTDSAASLTIAAPEGNWDLRDHLEVHVRIRNSGTTPATIKARVDCKDDSTAWISSDAAIAPNSETELIIPFASAKPWIFGEKTNNRFASDITSGVTLAADPGSKLTLLSLRAGVPAAPKLPEWLGKRPPVEGEWTATLDDEFTGTELDARYWSLQGSNFWDKRCHFSAEQVTFDQGTVRLRFEKKTGHHNDNPEEASTDYATGFLTSYDRFAQRYGYFECRMKLPTSPGLWPAFWLMPDRGPEAGIWWKRNSTHNGGMEFDIFEYLTRYGPYRTNIAMHWDGYEKEHKHEGTDRLYFQPDTDGFVTTGLLWEPGRATYYLNGREVARWDNERICNVPAHILFTNVSGGWGGNNLEDSGLPGDLVIDYVRVWQRADLAAATTP
jgi:beta-glucanase (GH16 family)